MSGENCTNCKYGGIQICRRNPPDFNGRFVFILEDWRTWCGEYCATENKGAHSEQTGNSAMDAILALRKFVDAVESGSTLGILRAADLARKVLKQHQ